MQVYKHCLRCGGDGVLYNDPFQFAASYAVQCWQPWNKNSQTADCLTLVKRKRCTIKHRVFKVWRPQFENFTQNMDETYFYLDGFFNRQKWDSDNTCVQKWGWLTTNSLLFESILLAQPDELKLLRNFLRSVRYVEPFPGLLTCLKCSHWFFFK